MKAKKGLRLSIRFKTIILIVVFAFLLVGISMTYFSIVSSNTNKSHYKSMAKNLSNSVALSIDADKVKELKNQVKPIVDATEGDIASINRNTPEWDSYIQQFTAVSEGALFNEVRDYLRAVVSGSSEEVSCIYLSYVDFEKQCLIYTVDSADDATECPPGCPELIAKECKGVLTDPTIGFEPRISNTQEYGYIIISGTPIYLGEEIVGYAMVDISMTAVRKQQSSRIIRLFAYLASTVVLISIASIILIQFILVNPIQKLNKAANSYTKDDPGVVHEKFTELKINTHDEIEDLAISMKQMENDVHIKINELTEMNEELTRSRNQTEMMTELASRDGLTGVQNKIAYNTEIRDINAAIKEKKAGKFGIAMVDLNYLKVINDERGHDVGDTALVKLANIICITFAHSPVYRIGGDEFAVILRGKDYQNIDKLIDKFNERIEKLRDEEVSAAIGYSEYDSSSDESVDDVFKRADKAMYERKRQMKEND